MSLSCTSEANKNLYGLLPLTRLKSRVVLPSSRPSAAPASLRITGAAATVNTSGIVLYVIEKEHVLHVGGKHLLDLTNVAKFTSTIVDMTFERADKVRIVPSLSFGYKQNSHLPLHMHLDLDIVDKNAAANQNSNVSQFEAHEKLKCLVDDISLALATALNTVRPECDKMCKLQQRPKPKRFKTTHNCKLSCQLTAYVSQRCQNGGIHIVWTGGALSLKTLGQLRDFLAGKFNRRLRSEFNLEIDVGVRGAQLPGCSKSGLYKDVYKNIGTGVPHPILPWCPGGSCCAHFNDTNSLLVASCDTLCDLAMLSLDTYIVNSTTSGKRQPQACGTVTTTTLPPQTSILPNCMESNANDMCSFEDFCSQPTTLGFELPSLTMMIDVLAEGFVSYMWDHGLNDRFFDYLNNVSFDPEDSDKEHREQTDATATIVTMSYGPPVSRVSKTTALERQSDVESRLGRCLSALTLIAREVVVRIEYTNLIAYHIKPTGDNTHRVQAYGPKSEADDKADSCYIARHGARLVYNWITGSQSLWLGQNPKLDRWVFTKMNLWSNDISVYSNLASKLADQPFIGIVSLLNCTMNLPNPFGGSSDGNSQQTTHKHVKVALCQIAMIISENYIVDHDERAGVAKYEFFVHTILQILHPVVYMADEEKDYLWHAAGVWRETSAHDFGSVVENNLSLLSKLTYKTTHPKSGELVMKSIFSRPLTAAPLYEKSKTMWSGLTSLLLPAPNGILLTSDNAYFSLHTRQIQHSPLYHIYTDCSYSLGVTVQCIEQVVSNVNSVWKLYQHLLINGYSPPAMVLSPSSFSSSASTLATLEACEYKESILSAAGLANCGRGTRRYLLKLLQGYHFLWQILRQPNDNDLSGNNIATGATHSSSGAQPSKQSELYDSKVSSERIAFVISQLSTIVFRRDPKYIWILHSSLPNTSKSTFLKILSHLLGKRYASLVAASVAKSNSSRGELKRPDLINLNHRYVYGLDEVPTGSGRKSSYSRKDRNCNEMDNQIVRQITGNNESSGFRALHRNNAGNVIQFRGALVIACNQLPCIETDEAINRRLVFTSFKNQYDRTERVNLVKRIEDYIVPALLAFTLADYYMRPASTLSDHRGPDHKDCIPYYDYLIIQGPLEDLMQSNPCLQFVTKGLGNATLAHVASIVHKFGLSNPNSKRNEAIMDLLKERGGFNVDTEVFENMSIQSEGRHDRDMGLDGLWNTKQSASRPKRRKTSKNIASADSTGPDASNWNHIVGHE